MTYKDCRANDYFFTQSSICFFGEMTPFLFRGNAATPKGWARFVNIFCLKLLLHHCAKSRGIEFCEGNILDETNTMHCAQRKKNSGSTILWGCGLRRVNKRHQCGAAKHGGWTKDSFWGAILGPIFLSAFLFRTQVRCVRNTKTAFLDWGKWRGRNRKIHFISLPIRYGTRFSFPSYFDLCDN